MQSFAIVAAVVAIFALAGSMTAGGASFSSQGAHPERRGLNVRSIDATRSTYQVAGARQQPIYIDPYRTLFVNTPERLAGLSFKAIMDLLASDAGLSSAKELFAQWFGTLGTAGADDAIISGLACPGTKVESSPFAFNGYAMDCDDSLAGLARLDNPFERTIGDGSTLPNFIVVAAINRFDLSQEFYDCGEYRIVVALDPAWSDGRPSGIKDLYINIEASIPDARNDLELCKAIQRFWADLSLQGDDTIIADRLGRFFLDGGGLSVDGTLNGNGKGAPFALKRVMSAGHLGGSGSGPGQLRLNSNTSLSWVLREFEFVRWGTGMRIEPVPVSGTPDKTAVKAPETGSLLLLDALKQEYGQFTSPTFQGFGFSSPWPLNASQQAAPDNTHNLLYPVSKGELLDWFTATEKSTGLSSPTLSKRLEVLTCAGCHRTSSGETELGFSDLCKFPLVNEFTHISAELEHGQYPISPALTDLFLPERERILRTAMGWEKSTTPAPVLK